MNTTQNERRNTMLWGLAGLAIIAAVFGVDFAIYPSGRMPYGTASTVLAICDAVALFPGVALAFGASMRLLQISSKTRRTHRLASHQS